MTSEALRDLRGESSWGFGTTLEDDAAETLIDKVADHDSDDGSTTAVHGNEYDSGMEVCGGSPPGSIDDTADTAWEDDTNVEFVDLGGPAEDSVHDVHINEDLYD